MEFSQSTIVDYVQKAIHANTGDDLERARVAFRGMSPEQLQTPYGESDSTPQKILDEYERERALATAAMRWVCDRV